MQREAKDFPRLIMLKVFKVLVTASRSRFPLPA
jgi:hypothetical protein